MSDLASVEQEEEAPADPTTDCTGPDALIVQEEEALINTITDCPGPDVSIVQEEEAPIDPTTDCPGPDASIVQEEEAPIDPTTDCPCMARRHVWAIQEPTQAYQESEAGSSPHQSSRNVTTQPQVLQGSDLAQEQEHDESLQKARESAGQDGSAYYYQSRWLYHRSYGQLGNELQKLVLPQSRRTQAIKIAHSVPMAGHLG